MSNEAAYREIMAQRAQRASERKVKYYDRLAYKEGQEAAREFIRSLCSCSCGKCGCCS